MSGSGGSGGCCRCCFSFILTSGFTALFLWLSLRASKPRCSIHAFYLPALNKTANSTSNHTIVFELKLDNKNKDKGIYYDALNLTFYYFPNRSFPIATTTVPQFYQGHKKTAHRKGKVETRDVPWEAVSRAVSNGSVAFRVDLDTAVRFKIMAWRTKRHKLRVGADVDVNGSGTKVRDKDIRLSTGAPKLLRGYRTRLMTNVIVFVLFNSMFIII